MVERILGSRHFANAPTKQRFLQLVSEAYLDGRASELNEYLIGCEVFDRDSTYNPALDPIVRVGAHGLRKKLGSYYKGAGKDDEIVLEIPVGSYIPIFTRRVRPSDAPEPARSAADPGDSFRRRERFWIGLLSVLVVSLVIAVLWLTYANRQLRRSLDPNFTVEEAGLLAPVWRPFLKNQAPVLLVLSNRPVYRFWTPSDPSSLSDLSIDLTPAEAQAMEKRLGQEQLVIRNWLTPRLVLSYDEFTSLGETVGLHRITRLFEKMGKTVLVKQSRSLKNEEMSSHDTILLGSVWIDDWMQNDPIKKCFINSASATLIGQHLSSRDEQEFSAKYDERTGKLVEDYAIITVKPGMSEKHTMMVLAGTHSEGTQAAAEYLTDEGHLADLNRRLIRSEGDFPKYFQVLLKISVNNGLPTEISVVDARDLQSIASDYPAKR